MRNFLDNGAAQNKKKREIVYRFADGTKTVITESDYNAYIAENPIVRRGDKTLTPPDFETLKTVSDEIYEQEDKSWNVGTQKNLSYDVMSASGSVYRYGAYAPSPETLFFAALDEPEVREKQRRRLMTAKGALETLTKVQRRRYIMYAAEGKTIREIAETEGVIHSKVQNSLDQAKKKIEKFISDEGAKRPKKRVK